MLQSYEYIQFLNEQLINYLPTQYKRIGDKINFKCPLCGDGKTGRKKRGWFYTKSASYYCFNCGVGLSGIKLLEFLSGNNYEQIRKEYLKLYLKSGLNPGLSAHFNIPASEEPSIFELQSIIKQEWKKPLSEKAKQYLINRKINEAPYKKQELYSYITKNNDEYILIPWRLNGIDAYYQLNDYQKIGSIKYIFPKEKKKLLYGLDNIDLSWDKIIITEGVYDSLFVKNGCACGTKSITDYQLSLIKERFPRHQIVISFDNDKDGIKSMAKLLKEDNNFKYFRWFNSNTKQKDINDYVLFKNNVNIFTDAKFLETLIIDKLSMKMHLLQK